MATESAESIEYLRQALADLTARLSDLDLESSGLGRDTFAELVVGESDEETFRRTARLLIGYGNLATRLVVMAAKSAGVDHSKVMEELGRWISRMEAQPEA